VTIQIAITNNLLPEGNRTVTMTLTNAVNSLLASPSNATLTIIDTVRHRATCSSRRPTLRPMPATAWLI
jgi:hypothetical protein